MESEEVVLQRFGTILDKIWAVVGARLLWQTLRTFSANKSVTVGDLQIIKGGIWLKKKRWMSSEPHFVLWDDLRYWSRGGCLYIESHSENKASAQLSFRDVDNVHLLHRLLEFLWKDGNHEKLRRGEFGV